LLWLCEVRYFRLHLQKLQTSMAHFHRIGPLLLVVGFTAVLPAVSGCQGKPLTGPQPNAKDVKATNTRDLGSDVSAGVVMVPVVVPSLVSGNGWDVLPPQQARRLLETPMPPVTEANRSLSVEQVIETISGKRLVWLPPEPHPEPVSYGNEAASTRGKTLGQYLRGLVGGSTALGYPRVRMMQAAPATRSVTSTRPQSELIDIVIVTKRHIAIVAAPRE
jgi:hypothetical protein